MAEQIPQKERIDNRYPLIDLDTSIEIARVVQQHGGEWTTEELVDLLSGGAALGGTQLSKVNAARFFGLLGTTSCSIATTQLARRALSADSAEALSARQEAFLAIPLYRELYKYCQAHGDHSRDEAVIAEVAASIYGVPQHRSAVVAQTFLSSLRQAGLE